METSLFGSRIRYELLLAVAYLGSVHVAELARAIDRPYRSTFVVVESLQNLNILATSLVGRSRVVKLNPRYFAAKELESLLLKLIDREIELRDRLESVRKRPRRIAKPL